MLSDKVNICYRWHRRSQHLCQRRSLQVSARAGVAEQAPTGVEAVRPPAAPAVVGAAVSLAGPATAPVPEAVLPEVQSIGAPLSTKCGRWSTIVLATLLIWLV